MLPCVTLTHVLFLCPCNPRLLHSFPTRRSSDLPPVRDRGSGPGAREPRADLSAETNPPLARASVGADRACLEKKGRSEEHTSELQSRFDLVCRLLLEKKKNRRAFAYRANT